MWERERERERTILFFFRGAWKFGVEKIKVKIWKFIHKNFDIPSTKIKLNPKFNNFSHVKISHSKIMQSSLFFHNNFFHSNFHSKSTRAGILLYLFNFFPSLFRFFKHSIWIAYLHFHYSNWFKLSFHFAFLFLSLIFFFFIAIARKILIQTCFMDSKISLAWIFIFSKR